MRFEKKQKPLRGNRKHFAKKSFGQNFLVDENYIDKIIRALNPQKNDAILEIGPGRGALTERLVEKAGRVVAIELDRDLVPFLREKFRLFENFEIIESDALKVEFSSFFSDSGAPRVKLVANLPYNISTAILQRLIEQRESFEEMVLMFQREVVDRITARVGNSDRGYLTVLTEAYLETEKLFDVSPKAFRPVPHVWSSIVRLIPKEKIEIADEDLFRQIVSAAFQQKRKTIFNNLKNSGLQISARIEIKGGVLEILEASKIDPARRAETLSLDEWKDLVKQLA